MNWNYVNCWRVTIYLSLFILCIDCNDVYVSQISPKSSTILDNPIETIQGTFSSSANEKMLEEKLFEDIITNHKAHSRIERSALPILNEISSQSNSDLNKLKNEIDSGKRYYYNTVKPTSTLNKKSENAEITETKRIGKNLSNKSSFLLMGGLRSLSSGSPIQPTTVMPQQNTAIVMPTKSLQPPNKPRQNANPDIQDIITGIVKLLNGNVNVHANTQQQAIRRPIASRINNRGPPRISEAQPLPIDYDGLQKPQIGASMLPPPFPFDRPIESRPFITGVPIPEQIVPTMQHRPSGFINQNRPPWNRPRPPINNRIPISPYKPYLPNGLQEQYNEDTQHATTDVINIETLEISTDVGQQSSNDSENETDYGLNVPNSGTTETYDKNEVFSKKKENYNKDKKTSELKNLQNMTVTIIESTTVQTIASTTISPNMEEDTSMDDNDDIHFITTSRSVMPTIQSSITEIKIETSSLPQNESILVTTSQESPILDSTTSSATMTPPISSTSKEPYHPRPGIVLDDPEFKPGHGHARPIPNHHQKPPHQPIQPTRLPPGYGEIFDVTLSAIQGPGNGGIQQQTVNIKPYGSYGIGLNDNDDIIISASGEQGFVSIDGKRTYINLFGESTEAPAASTAATSNLTTVTSTSQQPSQLDVGHKGSAVAVDPEQIKPTKIPLRTSSVQATQLQRPHYRPRTTQPPVRIDTCIVGDDSTCDQAQNERCKTENGISSCHCRPGYSRRKHREPCRRVVSFFMSLRVDKIYERRIVWDNKLLDKNSEHFGQLSFESIRAIDSAMSMTPFSDEFMEAKVNNIYQGDASQGTAGIFVNLTLKLEENGETLRPTLRNDIQKHLLGVVHRRNNNIGNSVLYVDSPPGSISNLQDLDECQSIELNDCHQHAICSNIWGSFRCHCDRGYRDPWSDSPQRAGKECQSCPDAHCNNRGSCSYESDGAQVCKCESNFYGSQCEIDGEVLGVAIGASVTAVIIIVLTLICLIMWSRRWHREQKNAMGSPVFGYMNTNGPVVKAAALSHPAYQVTLEDRMRWAQIADVMAQTNHYGADPVAPSTRPSSALFGYPSLQPMGMGTLGGMSIHQMGTLPMHNATSNLPPVPLPRRLGLNHRSNGMRTLENSSSSEEEDRTDLLGRNFHVPRPKSRSNGSIANNSGIYYDVDYEPSGYGGTTTTTMSNNNNPIPMSTYTSSKAPAYYMK